PRDRDGDRRADGRDPAVGGRAPWRRGALPRRGRLSHRLPLRLRHRARRRAARAHAAAPARGDCTHALKGSPMDDRVAPLFTPFALRSLRLANRIVMAPMTRGFSPQGVPGADVAAYYVRRADTGLILTEGVGVDHPAALGGSGVDGDNAPHMYGRAALDG